MCVGSSDEKRNLAISSLAKDPGFEDIIPHLVSFVTEGVRMNVNEQNMVSLIYLMRMVDSFVSNPNINIEHYLHDIIPSVLTCVITKTLYKKQDENHWALRDYSAKLITVICKKFSDSYNNYHAQIYGLISEIISSDNFTKHTWNAKYGAIKILCELGSNSLKVYMLPKLKFLSDQMVDHLDSSEIEALAQKAIKKIWNTLQ
ncbi:MAG: Transcription initiation factor TFIID subunit 6, partial [Paramarteilia canceri]